MENYPSNSHKSREEQKRSPVIENAQTMKRNHFQKIADMFLADDIDNIKKYVVREIVVPGIKGALLGTVEALLGVKSSSTKASTISTTKTPYYKYSASEESVPFSSYNRPEDYADPIVNSMRDAQRIMQEMNEIMGEYHFVTILQLYNACHLPTRWTDNSFGWTDLSNVHIVQLHDGRFRIKMPRPVPID